MELNIAPVSSSAPIRRPSTEKTKVRGSWKKRRRDDLVKKVKERRKYGIAEEKKPRSVQIQAEEFASGIDSTDHNGASEPKPEHPRKRQKKGEFQDRVKELPNVIVEGTTANLPSQGTGTRRDIQTKKGKPMAKPRAAAAADQTPEAVSATLAVIGTEKHGASQKANSTSSDENEDNCKEPDAEAEQNQEDSYFAVSSFAETGLYRSIVHHVTKRLGMELPTKVQEKVLKKLLQLEDGQQSIDLLVRSATGSGKTLAYLLPIAHYLLNRNRRITREDGSMAVVIVPTRELAVQVEEVAEALFRPWHWIVVSSVVGGERKKREKARLRKGVNVLVCTPGRLLDHMRNTQSFRFGLCEFLVLDEADRLLDLGFEAEIKEAVQTLDNQAKVSNPDAGKVRCNILLSATLRKDVQKLAEFSLQDPVEIIAASEKTTSGKFAMPSQLNQHFAIVEQRYRLVTLACFLRLRALKDVPAEDLSVPEESLPACKSIVFFSTCDSVDFHYDLLRNAKRPNELRKSGAQQDATAKLIPLQVFRIHGNHTQADRLNALRSFRKCHRGILLCTDVAARGLDLKGLTFAIQYDPPTGGQGEELEYLHRAGRTARIGERGDALLFLLPSERAYIGKLESKGVSIKEISGSAALAALYPRVDLSEQASISYGTRLVTSAVQEALEDIVKDNEEMKQRAVAAYQAYCRAYATHAKEVRYFFHVKNLHLGHVARAFTLSDKPAEFSALMADVKGVRNEEAGQDGEVIKSSKGKGDIARAIAEGERQPFNDQRSELARRRREKGRGQEAYRELAMEFGS